MIRRLCVFCGSSTGNKPIYAEAARHMGAAMASQGIELIYGGGRVGLMGAIADEVLARGGKVTGIIPKFLADREVAHTGLTELVLVHSMHERKAMMAEMSDGFVAMPGGVGTFEEFIEIMTWSLLGLHGKPCAVLNTDNYYDGMLQLFSHASAEGFLADRHKAMVLEDNDPVRLVKRLQDYRHTTSPKFSKEEAQELS